MKIFRFLCIATLCFSSAVGAEKNAPDLSAGSGFDLSQQLLAELKLAPKALVSSFVADEGKLQNFIAGRLQDMALADHARKRGLDREPNLFARRLVEERSELVKAAVLDFQQAEQARLPDLEPLARQRYLANRQQFAVPERIRVAHILLRADVEIQSDDEIAQQKAKAGQLKTRLAAGEDFAALAREFSEEQASAENGGELPRLTERGRFVPPFDKAAWALSEGETSEVVRTRFGFHIIKLLERKPVSYKPFEEVRDELVQVVQNDILAPRRSAFVDSFRGPALDAKASLLAPEIQQALKEFLAAAPGGDGEASAARADEAQGE